MSTQPEPSPVAPADRATNEPAGSASSGALAQENASPFPGGSAGEPLELKGTHTEESQTAAPDEHTIVQAPVTEGLDQTRFVSYSQPSASATRPERIPHFGHVGLLAVLATLGWVVTVITLSLALHAHLWGISDLSQAQTDYHYALSTETVQYFVTFAACLLLFPIVWHKPFFDGIHWRGSFALQRVGRLLSAAVLCFFVAMINGMLMPGPTNAPIDELFRAPGAAWAFFGFGVTLAPFFEEMAFRGFLLPSLCTAWDWTMENLTGAPRRPLDENGSPNWSLPAMVFGSVVTSVPFALMHGVQTAWSLGPFLLLIFVSLVLCWTRLSTRSLAASTIVHASYNFMLFSFMLLGTGGFKHLDKM